MALLSLSHSTQIAFGNFFYQQHIIRGIVERIKEMNSASYDVQYILSIKETDGFSLVAGFENSPMTCKYIG